MAISGAAAGSALLYKELKNTLRLGYKILRSTGNFSVGIAKKGLSGADAAGKFIVEHPKSSIGAGLVGGVGLQRLKGKINMHMSHVDPDQYHTQSAPISGVKYRSPRHKEYLEKQNLIY